eukprot:12424307-Alexandrium_andersonii.AAC.1
MHACAMCHRVPSWAGGQPPYKDEGLLPGVLAPCARCVPGGGGHHRGGDGVRVLSFEVNAIRADAADSTLKHPMKAHICE